MTVGSLDTCYNKLVVEEAVDLKVGVQAVAQFSKFVKHNLEAFGSRFLGVLRLGTVKSNSVPVGKDTSLIVVVLEIVLDTLAEGVEGEVQVYKTRIVVVESEYLEHDWEG